MGNVVPVSKPFLFSFKLLYYNISYYMFNNYFPCFI